MELQFSTACLPYHPLDRRFALARALGVDGLELALTPTILWRGADHVLRLIERHRIAVRSVQIAPSERGLPERAEVQAVARFAAALPDCRVLVLPAPRGVERGGMGAYRELLRAYLALLAGREIALTIENPAPARGATPGPLARFPHLRRLVEEWDLGFTFNTSYAAGHGWVITEPLPQMGARLRNVHLSDFRPPLRAEAVLSPGPAGDHVQGRHTQQLPGQGILPLHAFLRALCRREYAGLLTLDVQPRSLRAWWPPTARGRLAEALAFCRATTRKRAASWLDAVEPEVGTPAEAENE